MTWCQQIVPIYTYVFKNVPGRGQVPSSELSPPLGMHLPSHFQSFHGRCHRALHVFLFVWVCSWPMLCSTKSWSTADISRTLKLMRTWKAKPRLMSTSTCVSSPEPTDLPTIHLSPVARTVTVSCIIVPVARCVVTEMMFRLAFRFILFYFNFKFWSVSFLWSIVVTIQWIYVAH